MSGDDTLANNFSDFLENASCGGHHQWATADLVSGGQKLELAWGSIVDCVVIEIFFVKPKEICPRTPRNNTVRIRELFINDWQIEVKTGDTLVTIK